MRSIWYYFGGLACWLLSMFFYLQPPLWGLQWGYRLAELHEQLLDRKEENRALRVERARLYSLQRIERIAREELGMDLPEEQQVVLIRTNDS